MKWVIRSKHSINGNIFYLEKLRTVDGIVRPVNCHRIFAPERAAVFPSISAACAVIRQVTDPNWEFRIRPSTCVFWIFDREGARQ